MKKTISIAFAAIFGLYAAALFLFFILNLTTARPEQLIAAAIFCPLFALLSYLSAKEVNQFNN